MHKIWAVIRREFVERVRTRAFLLSTILFPLFMAAMVVIPGFLMSRSTGTQRLALVDATTDDLGQRMAASLSAARVGRGEAAPPRYRVTRIAAADRALPVRDSLLPMTGRSRKLEGFEGILVVTDSTVTQGKAEYFGANVASFNDMRELEQNIRPIVIARRLEGLGVDLEQVMKSVQGIDLVTNKVADGKLTGESGAATFALAYAMGFILYFSLLIFGTQVMNSIVEEKNNRIVEILASSLTPFQMMLGKVVGVGLVALLQIGIWAGAATFFSVFALIRDPNGTAAYVLSFVPMLTPFVIPMRYSISPLPMVELLTAIAITVLGLLAVVWVAARIYRVGILSYGKKASVRDMIRWIRTA